MWNLEFGVLNESRWMLNGFIMGSMGRRGCVFTVQIVLSVSKYARQWDVWNARNLAHPTNPVEGCADANPKTMLPNDT